MTFESLITTRSWSYDKAVTLIKKVNKARVNNKVYILNTQMLQNKS